jgi:hypothetical protein
MLLDGAQWHETLSAVAPLGHYHTHAVADAGAAFVAAGLGLLVRAWRPSLWFVAIGALAFVLFHGLVHASGITGGHTHDSIASLSLFAIPAALPLWAALPAKAGQRV